MMNCRPIICCLVSLLLTCLCLPAAAQSVTPHISSNLVGGFGVPSVGIYCMDANGYAQICSFSGGGSGGGTVTQGAAGVGSADTWLTSDTALDALISGGKLAVSGTFWQATQPISAASLPLPAGAATSANQPAINADAGAQVHVMNLPTNQAVTSAPYLNTPGACTAYSISSASTAVSFVTGPVKGVLLKNPLSAAGEGITAAENIYWSIVTTATTTEGNAVFALEPGASQPIPALASGQVLSVIAATASHRTSCMLVN